MDMTTVRGQFPALSRDQVYFDNAGGSQTLGAAIESIRDYLSGTNVQLGATYTTSSESTSIYEKGYEAAAKYINASREEIVLGASTTQLFRNLSFALNFNAGDEIVISGIDHEANIAPWVDLAERQKLVLKWWLPSSKQQPKLLAEDLNGLLSERTRLVTCTHASNILGTIHDIKAISSTVHARCPKALVCVDAVAYAPHRQIDVKDLEVDVYAFSWYKVYGPHMSMLYASPSAQEQMRSLGHYFNSHKKLEDKMGLSASSYELVSSIPAVASYLSDKWTGIGEQEQQLQKTLLDYLNGREDVTIHGETSVDGSVRVPTISFTVKGWKSQDLVETIEKGTNFGFRWGGFYSNRLVADFLGLGRDGVVRVSMVHYNTVDEVKAFIAVLDKVLTGNWHINLHDAQPHSLGRNIMTSTPLLPTPDTSHVSYARVYEPAEDSFLLLDTLSAASEVDFLTDRFRSYAPLVLEVGTGSGVVIGFINAQAQPLFGTRNVLTAGVDINRFACKATAATVSKAAEENSQTHGRYLTSMQGDLTGPFRDGQVDVLVFNPPYVPTDELPKQDKRYISDEASGDKAHFERDSYLLSLSYAGGKDGMETTDRLIDSLPNVLSSRGCAYVLLCAQNNPEEVKDRIRAFGPGWNVKTVGESGKQAGWEKLQIIRIWRGDGA